MEAYLQLEGVRKPTLERLVESYASLNEKKCELSAAEFWSYPDHLYKLFLKQWGKNGADKVMEALNRPAPITIRANLLKTTRDELRQRLAEEGIETKPTEYSPYGLVVLHRVNFSSLEFFQKGWFEVQDEGSQLASKMVSACEGETILDACAGGGGKSLFFAMEMRNRGTILANDSDVRKLKNLKKRVSRAGASCIRSLTRPNELEAYQGKCDAVVVDAPCSGTGTIRRSPDLKWRLTASQMDEYPKKQIELLGEYSDWVKPDGRLIYITCSLLEQENEKVVQKFAEQSRYQSEAFFRTLPSEVDMDGFFVCVLKKRSR
jgi:16S rRNA (cytosine967-C5)-methyltransferase